MSMKQTRSNPEYHIQTAIVAHHQAAFPHIMLVYVPNARKDATTGYFNKQLGLKKGASDLFLFWKWSNYGVFEVKAPGEKPRSDQNKFISAMAGIGAHHGWGSSVKAYHDTLIRWGIEPWSEGLKEPDLRSTQQKFRDNFAMFAPRDSDAVKRYDEVVANAEEKWKP